MAEAKKAQKPKPAKRKQAAKKPGAGPVLDVICPQCRGVFYETTEHYDPARVPNTSMVRLKEPYRSWGWQDVNTPPPGDGPGHMECPGCGAALVTVGMQLIAAQSKSMAKRMAAQKGDK